MTIWEGVEATEGVQSPKLHASKELAGEERVPTPDWLVGGLPMYWTDIDTTDLDHATDTHPALLIAAERKFHATGGLVGDWARRNGGDWS